MRDRKQDWRYQLTRVRNDREEVDQAVSEHVDEGWLLVGADESAPSTVDLVFRRPKLAQLPYGLPGNALEH